MHTKVNMPQKQPPSEELRAQIEAVTYQEFSTYTIEERIAHALLNEGHFNSQVGSDDLAVILRNIIYTMFARHRPAGIDVNLVHNVAKMQANINNSQAHIEFMVHIHKPIVCFIKFRYVLINDPVSVSKKLRLKKGTLYVKEYTRRFDLKAKAALKAINIEAITRQELADLNQVIRMTLPDQLERHGVQGELKQVELNFRNHQLVVCLKGDFTARHSS